MHSYDMHSVSELLSSRRQGKSDNYRLALCIEGGGMRAVSVGAMVCELHRRGLDSLFDDIYGTSAGALTGTYLLSGNPEEGTRLFWTELASPRFMRPWLLPVGGALNLDLLIDALMMSRAEVDLQAVCESPVKLHPLLSNASSRSSRDGREIKDLSRPENMLWALRAAVRVPIAAGNPWSRDPDIWRDAGLFEALPYRTALTQGATHVLLLRSVSPGQESYGPVGQASAFVYQNLFKRWKVVGYDQEERMLQDYQGPAAIEQVAPKAKPIASHCASPGAVFAYGQAGEQAMRHWLGQALGGAGGST